MLASVAGHDVLETSALRRETGQATQAAPDPDDPEVVHMHAEDGRPRRRRQGSGAIRIVVQEPKVLSVG